jgi:phosphate transport system substrate-binding protein
MKKRIALLLVVMIMMASLVGCKESEVVTNNDTNKFSAQMTFNGSSTLAPVISTIATEFIEGNTTWDKVDPSFPAENISIYVSAGGSGAGAKSVIEGTSDFGMLARGIKSEEKEQVDNLKEIVLGIDALTISINPDNPLAKLRTSLDTEEIMKIFSGEYKYWDDLDSSLEHKEIVVVIRDLGGGAHEVFQKSIMGDVNVREDAIQSPSMGALVTKIIENKDAIGYASYGMVNQNVGKLIPLEVDGVEPTVENIVNGSYKVSRPLIVMRDGELTSPQQAFIDFVLSEEGSKLIDQMGFVPAN